MEYEASHISNPSSVPQGYVDSYSTLLCVMWEAETGVQGYPDQGYNNTRWLTGLWSTQAKVEGIVLKAGWHWCDCSVANDPLGEPGHTSLYVGLPTTWGSVDGDQILSPFFVAGLLIGDYDGYK
jgi:hypothetical protein